MIQHQRGVEGPRDLDHGTMPPDGRPIGDQPKWRRDFPIDWAQDEYVSRRELVKFMVLTSAAFVVGQFWIVLKSAFSRPASLSRRRADRPRGRVADRRRQDVHLPGGQHAATAGADRREPAFVAYDQQCTHLQCPVVPAVEAGRLHCPCHNGWFDLETGRPVAGPPQRALPRILVGDT